MHVEKINGKGRLASVLLKALVLASLISVGLLLVLAFVMLKLQPDTKVIELGIMVIYALSCLAGGWYSGRRMEKRKFLWGILLGALYFALLFLVSGMSKDGFQPEFLHSVIVCVVCCVGGMLGGMVAR